MTKSTKNRAIKKSFGISIIGGTGFIGQSLINYLEKKNQYAIKVLTRNNKLSNDVLTIKGDLFNTSSLTELLSGQDIVINLAYIPNNHEANIKAINILAKACIDAKISKLIHCSTAVVTGRVKTSLINEVTICNPLTQYEKTKFAIEQHLALHLKNKIELIIIRPTAVFGEGGLNLLKTIDSLKYKSRIFNTFLILINGKRNLHLVPIKEVVRCIDFLLQSKNDLSGEKFIISQDQNKLNTYYELIQYLAQKLGQKSYFSIDIPLISKLLKVILFIKGRSQVNTIQIFDSQKLHNYGFSSNVDFSEEIDELLMSLDKNENIKH